MSPCLTPAAIGGTRGWKRRAHESASRCCADSCLRGKGNSLGRLRSEVRDGGTFSQHGEEIVSELRKNRARFQSRRGRLKWLPGIILQPKNICGQPNGTKKAVLPTFSRFCALVRRKCSPTPAEISSCRQSSAVQTDNALCGFLFQTSFSGFEPSVDDTAKLTQNKQLRGRGTKHNARKINK